MKFLYPVVLVLILLLAPPLVLPARAEGNSSSLTLTVYPGGSVGIAANSTQSSMESPGTEPNFTLTAQARTANGLTTVNVNGTASLSSSELEQAPYNYSNSVSVSGKYANGVESGSAIIQAVPGVSSPLSTFKLSYNGNSTFITASGNGTLVYGTYADGVVINASTIQSEISTAQREGFNLSGLNSELATLPYGKISVKELTLSATYGADSATVNGRLELSGNVTILPFIYLADAIFSPFSTYTTTSAVSATVSTCSVEAPAYCDVTVQNTGSAATTITGCNLNLNSTSGETTYVGTVSPANVMLAGGSSANVMCNVSGGLSSSPSYYFIYGTLGMSNGAEVAFVWSSLANQTIPGQGATSSTTTAPLNGVTTTFTTSVGTTIMGLNTTSKVLEDILSAYSAILSSFQSYSYSLTYADGLMGFQANIQATQNLNLDKAFSIIGGLESSEGSPASASSFFNSTSVDISNVVIRLSEVQQRSGEIVTKFSENGLTIQPNKTVSGSTFNMSSLFGALGTTEENVTLVAGTNAAGTVNIELPAGTPAPAATSPHSDSWKSVTADQLAGIQFSVAQSSTSTTSSSTGGSLTSASTTRTSTSGSIPEFPLQIGAAAGLTIAMLVSYLVVRRRSENASVKRLTT